MNRTILIFSGIAMIWDILTSAVGLLSAFDLFEFGNQTSVFQLVVNVVFDNTIASIFAFVLTGAIICTDIWFANNFLDPNGKERRRFENNPDPYSKMRRHGLMPPLRSLSSDRSTWAYYGLAGWAIVKLYDFYSTLTGTAVCLIPDMLEKYDSISLKEVLESANFNQELFLYLLSFVVAASPIIFVVNLRKMG